jgi:hypothetical protein
MVRQSAGFGLNLELGFPVDGLEGGDTGATRAASVGRVDDEELDRQWGREGAETVGELRDEDGTLQFGISRRPGVGFLLEARRLGRILVEQDGRRVVCAPAPTEEWIWQRFLIGHALPFAALLQGLEVFHASAVVLAGRAVAFAAVSGSGKSSIALNLVAEGAGFLSDDVLAVEAGTEALLVHAGAGAANVRADAAEELAGRGALGEVIGHDAQSARVRVERLGHPVPLGSLYFLERTAAGEVEIETAAPVDPRLLLGSTFNLAVQTPERLAAQLDVCGRIADSAEIFHLRIPPGIKAPEVARAVQGHLRS